MIDTRTAPYAALLLRLALGAMFIAHGLLKVLVFTLPSTVAFFQSVGLPGFFAYPTAFAEIAGGAALIVGFQVRWIAALLIPVLLGATWVHSDNGWVFTSANGGWEYPAFLSIAALVQVLLGAGALAPGRNGATGLRTKLQAA
jgi:putative oxidoreductase